MKSNRSVEERRQHLFNHYVRTLAFPNTDNWPNEKNPFSTEGILVRLSKMSSGARSCAKREWAVMCYLALKHSAGSGITSTCLIYYLT